MRVYVNQIADQELQARCCALFSRSSKPFDQQVKEATEEKVDKFLKTYVTKYGHNSINDCGMVCIAIERVSMLAAKFIEDYPLFNGQESSTRYMDFDKGLFSDTIYCPYEDEDNKRFNIQSDLLGFYRKALPIQIEHVRQLNEISPDDTVGINACKAKAFDVLRGFLPAGCKTQLAWVTTFRQAIERIEMMLRHPLQEINNIGRAIQEECLKMYPAAFEGLTKENHIKVADEYYNNDFWDCYYIGHSFCPTSVSYSSTSIPEDKRSNIKFNRHTSKKLPPIFDMSEPSMLVYMQIDYGSWRDIHRHRNCQQMHPLLTAENFEEFYLANLAPSLQTEACHLILNVQDVCKNIEENMLNQYCIPMGFKVSYNAKWTYSQMVYVMELRSKQTVHHTLRVKIRELYEFIARNNSPHQFIDLGGINVDFSNMSEPLKVNIERGKQA